MRILVTNDDGINAAGLKVLQEIAEKLSGEVWVVAPQTNQSGAAHSLTIQEPLRSEEVGERMFAVRGTPTDCVIMGLRHIMLDNPPDLVLSGVNHGSNMAEDVHYSGTIAGAIEGTMLGVRSIAMSLSMRHDEELNWQTPLAFGPAIIERLLAEDWPDGVLMNVNYPDCVPSDIVGTTITRQGRRDQSLMFMDERHDTWGTPYYWFNFDRRKSNPDEGTDLWANYRNLISVTPLHVNLTHRATADRFSNIFDQVSGSKA